MDNHIEDAELLDATKGLNCAVGWKEGTLKGTLRFSPSISCCGGMFIAKLKKKLNTAWFYWSSVIIIHLFEWLLISEYQVYK